jgi:hypothetical protein
VVFECWLSHTFIVSRSRATHRLRIGSDELHVQRPAPDKCNAIGSPRNRADISCALIPCLPPRRAWRLKGGRQVVPAAIGRRD